MSPVIPDQYRQQVQSRLVQFVYENIPIQLLVVPLVGAILAWIFTGIHSQQLLLGWVALLGLILVGRLLLWRIYRTVSPSPERSKRWEWLYLVSIVVMGLAWGIAAYAFFTPEHLPQTMVLTIAIAGITAGSFISLSAILPAFISYSSLSVLPLAWRFFSAGGETSIMLGILCIIFLVTMIAYARRSHHHLKSSMVLQLEKEDLVKELIQQREEAEQANIAKSKFLASASHDLRQPLHALRLFVELLDKHIHAHEPQELINSIITSTDTLEDLFTNLLDLSKVDARVIEPEITSFPLQPLLERLTIEFSPIAQQNGLLFRVIPTNAIVHSDAAMLERILRNLISNAIVYTKKGSVLVGCRRHNDQLRIEVRDSGAGIPEDQFDTIFTEFQQLDNPERDRSKGLGLGLAIAGGLAKLLDTKIGVSSRVNVGSCFSISLPRGTASAAPQSRPQWHSSSDTLAGYVIVFIDDEQSLCKAMRMLLLEWGCHPIVAEDLDGALQQLESALFVPDIVIADYRLREGKTGTGAIEQLRDRYGHLPAIIVTGDTETERLQDVVSSDSRLLHKPVRSAELRHTIEQLLTAEEKETATLP
jgi:signal transduction histidine kinase/CheY-like chemotaxis protein